ncbi:hypothetical protein QBC47DRAFT_373119 [Echria macrotheca]|uniref:F-box domain-containing protein n=1 Tax=Echria macrotheca TaxID=438768 RepID=A0AAJ0BN06_9PEZI|nr:hypothetical protein QBC47DRAFT_373119 [Echria macrotheca]
MGANPVTTHYNVPRVASIPFRDQRRPLHTDTEGRMIFWEPSGPVAQVWQLLGPCVRRRVQALAAPDATFSIHMAIIGETAETGEPNVVLCADDPVLQQTFLHDDGLKSILMAYPQPIRLDFSPNLPQLLAQDRQDVVLTEIPRPVHLADPSRPYSVWAAGPAPRVGARLYVRCRDGTPRMSTAGPVFLYRGKAYQTTVRHVFFKVEETTSSALESAFPSDLDLDDSDTDDTSGFIDCKTFCNTSACGTLNGSSSVAFTLQGPALLADNDVEVTQLSDKGKDPEIPRDVSFIGSAVLASVESANRAVDCALFEVHLSRDDDPNMVSYDPTDSSKKVRITRPVDINRIPVSGIPVVVATSSRPLTGKLFKTGVAYIKPRFQRDAVAAYPLKLDEGMALEAGDSGSIVFKITGSEVDIFGHVLFGHLSNAWAYILPINTIVEDIAKVLDAPEGISLHPGPYQGKKVEGGMRTEFASPKFYQDMEEAAIPEKHVFRGLRDRLCSKVGTARALLKVTGRDEGQQAKPYSFEQLFFALPPELRDQIIDFLEFREAWNLRQVSRRFRASVSVNNSAISRRFLKRNPLPPLALALYPHPSPDLAHIHKVGHYHAVAWRLADHMVKWLRENMYLYGSRFQKQQFQPKKVRMKQRLLPSLLVLGKFFERCRGFLECQTAIGLQEATIQNSGARSAEERGKCQREPMVFSFDREMMAGCSDDLLFQTHDTALILSTFLRQTMRPPSKYGRIERTFRCGLVKPLDEMEIAAVLYHGGLEVMVDILDLDVLDQKMNAVRKYCRDFSRPTAKPRARHSRASEETKKSTSPAMLKHLFTRLPPLDSVWSPSAAAVLLERKAIHVRLDLNSFAVALKQLFIDSETPADLLYRQGHDLWHALSDGENHH